MHIEARCLLPEDCSMRVKLADGLVEGKQLSKEGRKVFARIEEGIITINGEDKRIPQYLADTFQGILQSLLLFGFVECPEKQKGLPLTQLCELFRELGIFGIEKKKEGIKAGHGAEAAFEVLTPLQEKLVNPPDRTIQAELETKPVVMAEEKLEEIDKLLENLSSRIGSLRAAIVEVGDVPKKYETRDILDKCKMVRFFVENTKEEKPPPIEARTIMAQCFNFHRTIGRMNAGIKEESSARKKHPITESILLTMSEDTKIVFILDAKKPEYVLMLETYKEKPDGLIFLEMRNVFSLL